MTAHENVGFDGIRPILSVNNAAKAIDYYVNKLGFTLGFAWDDSKMQFLNDGEQGHISFAQVGFGAALIMLCEQGQGQSGMWIHLDLNSAEKLNALNEKWVQADVKIIESPSLRPWGTYEMRIEDLDGYIYRVSSPPEDTTS